MTSGVLLHRCRSIGTGFGRSLALSVCFVLCTGTIFGSETSEVGHSADSMFKITREKVQVAILGIGAYALYCASPELSRELKILLWIGLFLSGIGLLSYDFRADPNRHMSLSVLMLVVGISAEAVVLIVWYVFPARASESEPAISFTAFTSLYSYPEGTIVAGFTWRKPYREIRVIITNPSDVTFRDIDLVVKPDQPIAVFGIEPSGQKATADWYAAMLPEINLLNDNLDQASQTKTKNPIVPVSRRGIRVTCDKLLAHSEFEVVMGAVGMIEMGRPNDQKSLDEFKKFTDTRSAVDWPNLQYSEGDQLLWFVDKDHTDALFLDPPSVKKVEVKGEYTVSEQIVKISKSVDTFDDSFRKNNH